MKRCWKVLPKLEHNISKRDSVRERKNWQTWIELMWTTPVTSKRLSAHNLIMPSKWMLAGARAASNNEALVAWFAMIDVACYVFIICIFQSQNAATTLTIQWMAFAFTVASVLCCQPFCHFATVGDKRNEKKSLARCAQTEYQSFIIRFMLGLVKR